jgi:hypothetical protein
MRKIFCDICGSEIIEDNRFDSNNPIIIDFRTKTDTRIQLTKFKIEPHVNFNWEDADICRYCIFDKIKEMDDRE